MVGAELNSGARATLFDSDASWEVKGVVGVRIRCGKFARRDLKLEFGLDLNVLDAKSARCCAHTLRTGGVGCRRSDLDLTRERSSADGLSRCGGLVIGV